MSVPCECLDCGGTQLILCENAEIKAWEHISEQHKTNRNVLISWVVIMVVGLTFDLYLTLAA